MNSVVARGKRQKSKVKHRQSPNVLVATFVLFTFVCVDNCFLVELWFSRLARGSMVAKRKATHNIPQNADDNNFRAEQSASTVFQHLHKEW